MANLPEVSSQQRVDKSEDRIRGLFSSIAPRYDFMNHLLSMGTDFYWRWLTSRTVPLDGETPILDVCTGTADFAISYWKRGRRRLKVVGTDFTPEMLHIAKAKTSKKITAARGASAPFAFMAADTQALPFRDDQFQIVSVAFGLRNVRNTELGLREMARVCKPGGYVVILEISKPQAPLVAPVYNFYFEHILPRIGQLVAGSYTAYNHLPESVSEFPQGDALAAIMRRVGLDPVRWKSLTFGTATAYFGMKPHHAARQAPRAQAA